MISGNGAALRFASCLPLIALAASGCGERNTSNIPRDAAGTGNQSVESAEAHEAAELAKKCRKILKVAAPSDPARDILGVYPGMKAEDAILTLRCRVKNAKVETGYKFINYAPGKKSKVDQVTITGSTEVVAKGGDPVNELRESIKVGIGGPRGDERVLFISREAIYDWSKPKPELKETVDSFTSKYGEPSKVTPRGNAHEAVITYSRAGQPIGSSTSVFKYCGQSSVYESGAGDPGVCGLTILYTIYNRTDGVSQIWTYIDNPADTSARVAAAVSAKPLEPSLSPNL